MNLLKFHLSSLLLVPFFFVTPPAYSETPDQENASPTRVDWVLDESYDGNWRQQFDQLRWKIPALVRQTEIDLAVRIGLNFQDGWQYPISIGFVDGSPLGTENVLAYVQMYSDRGSFHQRLNINLRAYAQQGFEFEKVFAHELVHAMVNDAIGGDAALLLPVWFQEGLAVFGANQGEQLVETYGKQFYGFADQQLLNGLEGPHGALDYAEDYLAFQYLWKAHGQNAFHNFIREVIKRKGDILGALPYTCVESWVDFKKNARTFSIEELKRIGPPRRGDSSKPF